MKDYLIENKEVVCLIATVPVCLVISNPELKIAFFILQVISFVLMFWLGWD